MYVLYYMTNLRYSALRIIESHVDLSLFSLSLEADVIHASDSRARGCVNAPRVRKCLAGSNEVAET